MLGHVWVMTLDRTYRLEGQLREKEEAWEKIEKMALDNPQVGGRKHEEMGKRAG